MNIDILKIYKYIIFTVASLIICGYLFYNTGLHGDDMTVASQFTGMSLKSFLSMQRAGVMLVGPVAYYSYWWAYAFVGVDALWVYDAIKWFSCVLSIIFVYRFSLDYLQRDRALLVALLFVFNPVHEVTMYWYMVAAYVLTPSIIMLAHHYVRNEKYSRGFLVGCLGSFMGYVSPPYGIGLAAIFILEKSYKKALIFMLPALLYISYYFTIFIIQPSAEHRISHGLTIGHLIKNYLLEIPAFFDSLIGPSFWLKIYYSIGAISFFSLVLALLVVIFMVKNLRTERSKIPPSLLGGLIVVLLLSFGIFAIADIFGYRAFNLGDRLSVYGSLLIAFLVATIPLNRRFLALLAICFVLPTFGLSDHWKSWNATQIKIINRIKNNQDLKDLSESDTLLVADNMYSKLGPFSHIDFFNMPWNVDAILKPVVKCKNVIPLNTYIHFDGHQLIDDTSYISIEIVKDIYLYKSADDTLTKITPEQLSDILAKRPIEIRHWVQMLKGTRVGAFISDLSPRFAAVIK